MAQELSAIKESISEAFDVTPGRSKPTTKRRMRWDSKDLGNWVAVLNEHVSRFEERVEILLRACNNIDIAVEALGSAAYERKQFVDAVEGVQKIVDELSMAGYSDLASWVSKVNEKVGAVLAGRLEEALRAWYETFQPQDDDNDDDDESPGKRTGGKKLVRIPKISIEIMLKNQEISAFPAVPTARATFINELHDYMGIVCHLPCLNSGRFEVFESANGGKETGTFHYLSGSVSPEVMSDAYFAIECHVQNLTAFVDQWLSYQTLWDSQVAEVASAVEGDLNRWHELIMEASAARNTLDSAATAAEFGPIVVKYNKVQSQINLKFDSWQKELQTYFASVLAERINENYEKVSSAKTRLEGVSLEGSSSAATSEIVLGVTFLQEVTQQLPSWHKKMKELADSEKLLKRQRHAFRSDWVEASLVGGQLQQVEQLLAKRNRTMQEQVPLLQSRIVAEDKANAQRVSDLVNDWEQNKPLMGNITPDQAIEALTKFEFNMKKAQLDQENLVKAKDALGLDVGPITNEISGCLDEVSDLQEVWEAVSKPYGALLDLKDTLWATAAMRKVRKTLDDLLIDLRSLPNRIRQYDAYTALYDKIKSFLSGHATLSDMKTDALKDRHWKTILQRLNIHVAFSELTVGMLWDNGLLERKKDSEYWMKSLLSCAECAILIGPLLNKLCFDRFISKWPRSCRLPKGRWQ